MKLGLVMEINLSEHFIHTYDPKQFLKRMKDQKREKIRLTGDFNYTRSGSEPAFELYPRAITRDGRLPTIYYFGDLLYESPAPKNIEELDEEVMRQSLEKLIELGCNFDSKGLDLRIGRYRIEVAKKLLQRNRTKTLATSCLNVRSHVVFRRGSIITVNENGRMGSWTDGGLCIEGDKRLKEIYFYRKDPESVSSFSRGLIEDQYHEINRLFLEIEKAIIKNRGARKEISHCVKIEIFERDDPYADKSS